MISIKYDFPPSRASAPRSCLPRGLNRAASSPPPSLSSHQAALLLSHSFTSPTRSPPPRGGIPGFNPFPYNFLPMHREKLARNTHAHARTPKEDPSLTLASALARSLARWRSPIIRFHRIFVVRAPGIRSRHESAN